MSKFIILLIAAALIEGYSAADFDRTKYTSIKDFPKEITNIEHEVFPRDVSYDQPRQFSFTQGNTQTTGYGHTYSSGTVYTSNTDKDGKIRGRGVQVTNNDGQEQVKYFT